MLQPPVGGHAHIPDNPRLQPLGELPTRQSAPCKHQ